MIIDKTRINFGRTVRRFGAIGSLLSVGQLGIPLLLLLPMCCNAAIELKPGSVVEFASVEEGRRILSERETGFIQALSQFDRCVRMRTSRLVTEAEFVTHLTNQVRAWSAAEQTKVTGVLNWFANQIRGLQVSFPAQFYLVKTTGNEEGNAAYLRGSSIILPQGMVSANTAQLQTYLTHELFHAFVHQNPQLREALFRVIGLRLCRPIPMPDWLLERRITSPNPEPWDFYILVNVAGTRTPCVPVFFSKSTNYTGGQLFDYLIDRLLVLEPAEDGYRASCLPNGEPRLLDPWNTNIPGEDYYDQIGLNTSYNIHPEETLAENFVLVVQGTVPSNSPRVPYLLRQVINNPDLGLSLSPAGRFLSDIEGGALGRWGVEVSTDMKDWVLWEYVTNTVSSLEVVDPDAWLHGHQFYRARFGDPPVLTPGDTNHMVWIPPGSFLMGSPVNEAGRYTNEGPQTMVTVSRGFWIGQYEVTQGEYEAVMGADPSYYKGLPYCPVENVSWQSAVDYCGRLNDLERAAGRLPDGWAYRLPTEAEWEYAARAGTTNRYSFGDDPEGIEVYRYATFKDNRGWGRSPRPVTAKPPNAWGIVGLYGNVGEWCADWYGPYSGGSRQDPTGPVMGTEKIWRGGAYLLRHRDCRCACRNKAKPELFQPHIGFRIVLAPTRGGES